MTITFDVTWGRILNHPVPKYVNTSVGLVRVFRKMYRGCMYSIFVCFIATLSIVLGVAIGPIGFVLPPFLVLTAYIFLESLIIELLYLEGWSDRDR